MGGAIYPLDSVVSSGISYCSRQCKPVLSGAVITETPTQPSLSKHERIRQTLADAIASGQYEPGQRLPSESELVKTFGASRPTVTRALRELQLTGIIERRAGSGSYVKVDAVARGYTFGLLIPELGRTEIFEPICRGMAEAKEAGHHALLWGKSLADSGAEGEDVESLCRQLTSKKVSGVFFAPLELTPEKAVSYTHLTLPTS